MSDDENPDEIATEMEEQPDPDDGEMPANPIPTLYNLNISPAVRCVKIVARLINLELELR